MLTGSEPGKAEETDDDGVRSNFFSEISTLSFFKLDYDSNFNFPSKPRMTNGEEPEVIVNWRKTQAERIRAKDEEEEMKKKEMRERAKKDLEDWCDLYLIYLISHNSTFPGTEDMMKR